MKAFKPRFGILPPAQRRLWPELRAAQELGFVLYGGTAIALRLGHRKSIDFDFFTDAPLDKKALGRAFAFLAGADMLQDEPDTLTALVPGRRAGSWVKLSFFGRLPFGRFDDPQVTDDGVLQVASLDDLMGTKLKTILQRSEGRDYRDIAAMLRAGVDLARGLAIAHEMFKPALQPALSLRALTYFQGGDLPQLPPMQKNYLIRAAAAVRDLPVVRRRSSVLALRP